MTNPLLTPVSPERIEMQVALSIARRDALTSWLEASIPANRVYWAERLTILNDADMALRNLLDCNQRRAA